MPSFNASAPDPNGICFSPDYTTVCDQHRQGVGRCRAGRRPQHLRVDMPGTKPANNRLINDMAVDGVKSGPATQGAAPGRLQAIKLRFFSANGAEGLQRISNMARLFAAASVVLAPVIIATGSQITSAGVPPQVLLPQTQPQPPAQPPNVEANMARLHQRLQITPAQEAQFNAVANVMRQNARAEASAPQPPPANASAVESLRAEIQYDEMELAGMKKFLPALEALYATLSPAQRQTADAVLRQGPGG
jgi:hypothetical protein